MLDYCRIAAGCDIAITLQRKVPPRTVIICKPHIAVHLRSVRGIAVLPAEILDRLPTLLNDKSGLKRRAASALALERTNLVIKMQLLTGPECYARDFLSAVCLIANRDEMINYTGNDFPLSC